MTIESIQSPPAIVTAPPFRLPAIRQAMTSSQRSLRAAMAGPKPHASPFAFSSPLLVLNVDGDAADGGNNDKDDDVDVDVDVDVDWAVDPPLKTKVLTAASATVVGPTVSPHRPWARAAMRTA